MLVHLATAPPRTPVLAANAGAGLVALSWNPEISGQSTGDRPTSWDLYYGTSPQVTPFNGTLIANVRPPYVHLGLSNGTTYYYVLVAKNSAGSSQPSAAVQATPQAATSGSWTHLGGPAVPAPSTSLSLALAMRGTTPYAMYAGLDSNRRPLPTVRTYSGSAWSDLGTGPLNVDAYGSNAYYSVAQDGTNVYAAWLEQVGPTRNLEVVVKQYDGSSWTRLGGAPNSNSPIGTSMEMVGGTLHVAFPEASPTGYNLVAKSYSGSAWVPVGGTINSLNTSVSKFDLTDFSGAPAVAFIEEASERTAKAMRYSAGAWSQIGSALNPAGTNAWDVSTAAGGGKLYVALLYSMNSQSDSVLEVFESTGGGFAKLGGPLNVAGLTPGTPRVAVVGGVPYVAFTQRDVTSLTNLYVKRWDGSSWVTSGNGIRISVSNIEQCSKLVASGSSPYILCAENAGGEVFDATKALFVYTLAP